MFGDTVGQGVLPARTVGKVVVRERMGGFIVGRCCPPVLLGCMFIPQRHGIKRQQAPRSRMRSFMTRRTVGRRDAGLGSV
jgi:hypothetical protein